MLAIASIVTVILLLEGFYNGLLTQLRNTVLNRQADLIVVQAGVSNMTAARSVLPQYSRMDVEAIDGVSSAHPLTGISAIYEHDGLSTAVFVMGVERGMALINRLPGIDGIIIDNNRKLHYSNDLAPPKED